MALGLRDLAFQVIIWRELSAILNQKNSQGLDLIMSGATLFQFVGHFQEDFDKFFWRIGVGLCGSAILISNGGLSVWTHLGAGVLLRIRRVVEALTSLPDWDRVGRMLLLAYTLILLKARELPRIENLRHFSESACSPLVCCSSCPMLCVFHHNWHI